MTIPPHPCIRSPLISTEGIPGVGKTYLTEHAVNGLDGKPLILGGLSQRGQGSPDLGKALLRALRESSGPDPFLRGGAPAAGSSWKAAASTPQRCARLFSCAPAPRPLPSMRQSRWSASPHPSGRFPT